jgi:hypothetical protein
LARLQVRGDEPEKINEKTFATVKKMPFPFRNREFVVKFIWKSKEDNKLTVAFTSVDEIVDYGGSVGRLARGKTHGLLTVTAMEKLGRVPQVRRGEE